MKLLLPIFAADDFLRSRIAQPIADRINQAGVSHLTVASYAVAGSVFSCAAWGMFSYKQSGWALAIVEAALLGALFSKFVNLIWRDRDALEAGKTFITPAFTFFPLRTCTAAASVVFGFDAVISLSVVNVCYESMELTLMAGLYLWATLPRPPSRRHNSQFVTQGGAA